jgi:hypothetical protein
MHQINLLKVHEAFSYRMNITNIIRARARTMHLKQNKKHFFFDLIDFFEDITWEFK